VVDASWDNSGSPVASKRGLPWWAKLSIGCGAMLLVVLGTCAVGGAYITKNPERFRKQISSMVQDLIRKDWSTMRKTVEQLGTEQGTRELYEANPGLVRKFPTQQAFLEAARSWRPLLDPLPEALPELETHDLSYSKNSGQTEMRYRTAKGTRIVMIWTDGRLVDLRVY